jgi:serine/threonine protein kinase
VRPGALTALLQEIAAAPREEQRGAWEAILRQGATVGRFELVREMGRGGFGVVWEALDRELGRSVAFKAVRAGGKTSLREERLLREAEAAARLSHPNIVTLFDMGRAEQGPYLVLELLRGRTLAERLGDGPVPPAEAVRVATEIAKGVAHAHAQGVVHRDLKPENVFLCEDGQVKVLDFGLAHAFGKRRAAGGTSGYMAPEQVEGAGLSESTVSAALASTHPALSRPRAASRSFSSAEMLSPCTAPWTRPRPFPRLSRVEAGSSPTSSTATTRSRGSADGGRRSKSCGPSARKSVDGGSPTSCTAPPFWKRRPCSPRAV